MPPPRSSIHMEASMCIRPATMSSTDDKSKRAGTPSTSSILSVTLGSRAICAASAGSVLALCLRIASSSTYNGSANSMPKNMTHVWKTAGLKGSTSPLRPGASSWKSALEHCAPARPNAHKCGW
eukprot:scaffold5854_cov106-Isochrysis_galbana.AAC.2